MKITVKEMAETGMLVASAIILDLPFLKFRIGQNGGSISLTMVPLFVLAIRRGPLKGFIGCGIVYAVITCLIDGWGFATFPFDYFLGYGSIALAGFFRKQILENERVLKGIVWITIAVLLGCFGRLCASTISSMVFYEYRFDAALIYNVAYIGPATVLTLDAFIILYKPLISINKRFPIKKHLNK